MSMHWILAGPTIMKEVPKHCHLWGLLLNVQVAQNHSACFEYGNEGVQSRALVQSCHWKHPRLFWCYGALPCLRNE